MEYISKIERDSARQHELYKEINEKGIQDFENVLYKEVFAIESEYQAEKDKLYKGKSIFCIRDIVRWVKRSGYYCLASDGIIPPSQFDIQCFYSRLMQGDVVIDNVSVELELEK